MIIKNQSCSVCGEPIPNHNNNIEGCEHYKKSIKEQKEDEKSVSSEEGEMNEDNNTSLPNMW